MVGDFTVKRSAKKGYMLRPGVKETHDGNLVMQGFPFFSGSIVLAQDFAANPKPASTMTNAVLRPMPMRKARPKSAGAWEWPWPPSPWEPFDPCPPWLCEPPP